jgi:2-polyprenyl-3-methyl-5-hydroxy-6-metoxy-1,4-benzoquinol methylase
MSKYSEIWDNQPDISEQDRNTPWFKIMRWAEPGQKVLDIGCSSGYFGEKLIAKFGDKVWGVELDADDAAAARKRGYEAVFEGDLDNFDWSQIGSLTFDMIIFADVLEHVKDPVNVLQNAKKLLTKPGYIYSSIPNVANMTVRSELMEGNFDYEPTGLLDNTHIRFFTKKTVYKTFAEAGLSVTDIDATTNEYSEGQIKAHFERLGLQPTAQFDEVMHSPEARTFQFIVKAAPSDKPALPKAYTVSSKLHDEWPNIAKKMDDDDARIQELSADVSKLRAELNATNDKLRAISDHPVRWATKGAARKALRYGKKKSA